MNFFTEIFFGQERFMQATGGSSTQVAADVGERAETGESLQSE